MEDQQIPESEEVIAQRVLHLVEFFNSKLPQFLPDYKGKDELTLGALEMIVKELNREWIPDSLHVKQLKEFMCDEIIQILEPSIEATLAEVEDNDGIPDNIMILWTTIFPEIDSSIDPLMRLALVSFEAYYLHRSYGGLEGVMWSDEIVEATTDIYSLFPGIVFMTFLLLYIKVVYKRTLPNIACTEQ